MKLPDEPSPVPEGISARVVNSSDFPNNFSSFKTSLMIGCFTFLILLVFFLLMNI